MNLKFGGICTFIWSIPSLNWVDISFAFFRHNITQHTLHFKETDLIRCLFLSYFKTRESLGNYLENMRSTLWSHTDTPWYWMHTWQAGWTASGLCLRHVPKTNSYSVIGCYFLRDAMTNCHKLDKLKLTNLFSYNSGCHKSKIKWLEGIKLPPGTLRELFHIALIFQYFQEFHAWGFLVPISTLIFTWISLCLFSTYISHPQKPLIRVRSCLYI